MAIRQAEERTIPFRRHDGKQSLELLLRQHLDEVVRLSRSGAGCMLNHNATE